MDMIEIVEHLFNSRSADEIDALLDRLDDDQKNDIIKAFVLTLLKNGDPGKRADRTAMHG